MVKLPTFSSRKIIKKIIFLVGIFVFVLSQNSLTVAALTQAQKDSLKSGARYFNTEEDLCAPTTSPGQGAPDGAQFPNLDPEAMARAIDTWVARVNPNSTLRGLGSTIVASAENSNVSPLLIAAIARKESTMADPEDYNVKNGNNAFGRTAVEGQPSFQGRKTWYYWSSVKASIDHTAPENQNAYGGGDMASYLRERYGDQIDNNSVVALFMIYAPPEENDTELYIRQVQGLIDELVELTTGQLASGGGSVTPGTSGCENNNITSCTYGDKTVTGPNAENPRSEERR